MPLTMTERAALLARVTKRRDIEARVMGIHPRTLDNALTHRVPTRIVLSRSIFTRCNTRAREKQMAKAKVLEKVAATDRWMSAAKAAEKLGVSRPTVYAMVTRKELRSQWIAGRMVVRTEDVLARAA